MKYQKRAIARLEITSSQIQTLPQTLEKKDEENKESKYQPSDLPAHHEL